MRAMLEAILLGSGLLSSGVFLAHAYDLYKDRFAGSRRA